MKLIGERIFAKDATGRNVSRIGTLFFKTPGLVTTNAVHAMQRVLWLDSLNAQRQAANLPPLTPQEEEAELAESVDLIFTEDCVLIRPDPERMDLAFRADEELQKTISKRHIRYLNTNALKVRTALMARGENWRMARQPISPEDMAQLIAHSHVAIDGAAVYYYNRTTGTRYLTVSAYDAVKSLDAEALRRQVAEIVTGLSKRNRLGQPEIDIFPVTTPPEIKKAFRQLRPDELDDAALRAACSQIDRDWRMTLPSELREESVDNIAWRNEMCRVLLRVPNDTGAEERELIDGISPEFYRQVEWLPGVRIDRGEVIFDSLYEEAARTQDPELLSLCDARVKSFLFNITRLHGALEYVNVGRIAHSLARHPIAGSRRGNVYIMQYREAGEAEPTVMMIRLQKWGVAEHLDRGKDLLQAIVEADEYSDYILDRRLMCRQLGMALPPQLRFAHFTEKYRGHNPYNGVTVRTAYFARDYVRGCATDKIPLPKYRNPAWAQKFAYLLGRAAATDMIVGRRSTETHELLFDHNYEVLGVAGDGMPERIAVTDVAGSFVEYESPFEARVADYATAVLERRDHVGGDYRLFVLAYVEGFRRQLAETQGAYRARRGAFDNLFSDRPYDTNGSGAYRWACALRHLDACDPDALAAGLKEACAC